MNVYGASPDGLLKASSDRFAAFDQPEATGPDPGDLSRIQVSGADQNYLSRLRPSPRPVRHSPLAPVRTMPPR